MPNIQIPIAPAFKQALQMTTQSSSEKGRAVHMLKVGSKRKRTRKELEEVKEEEQRLRENRQGFLKEYQDLKSAAFGQGQQPRRQGQNSVDEAKLNDLLS